MSRIGLRRTVVAACFCASLFTMSFGMMCIPGGCEGEAPLDVPAIGGNRPPQIIITGIATPLGENVAEQGDPVTISFTGSDGEDAAEVRVFVSLSADPDAPGAIPVPVFGSADPYAGSIGPGAGTGAATWDTTGVPAGAYHIVAQIDDGVNMPVRVTFSALLTVIPVAPGGTEARNNPPQIVFLDPLPNLGLAALDEVTVRYIYADTDSDVTVTLLLDKDPNPTNDDVNNPGDPLDEETNIIILPSEPRLLTDPTFDGDPPTADDPNNPLIQADSLEIRRNPRTFGPTPPTLLPFPGAPLAGEMKEYRFVIDFSQIPVRSDPYFIRATITDGIVTVHRYAVGSLTISSLASGVVKVEELGFAKAGARFQGFSEGENLGTDFVAVTDLDLDGVDDFMIASRFGSPRNRFQSGSAYLIYGRSKVPFPPDTNNNGLPDYIDVLGDVVDLPEPPEYLPNPYDAANVGRFGGVVSINSVNSFFRGTIYGMPEAHGDTVPPDRLYDDQHPFALTGGLTSITRVDMTRDGVPDLVFGLPFIATAWDYHDDDPVDGGCDNSYTDYYPNHPRCERFQNDDIVSARWPFSPFGFNEVDQGIVIVVDGTNDIADTFPVFVDAGLAGQHDPLGPIDDEGVVWPGNFVPIGMRFRGGWHDRLFEDPIFENDSDCCAQHDTPGCEDAVCQEAVCTATLGGEDAIWEYCCDEDSSWDWGCAFAAQFICGDLCDFDDTHLSYSESEYGHTVAALPNFDNNPGDELIISSPAADPRPDYPEDSDRGMFRVQLSNDYLDEDYYGDVVLSLPSYIESSTCTENDPGWCLRGFVNEPAFSTVYGEQPGDFFGYARAAGDVNQDGTQDVLAGAPGADRDPSDPDVDCSVDPPPAGCLEDVGVVYILATPQGGFGDTDLATEGFPRIEIIGSHPFDGFGEIQDAVEDVNRDQIDDVVFASPHYDDDVIGGDAGFVGVIFGDRPITGELGFAPEDVGTSRLPGVRFRGASPGALAGFDVTSAGDFNGDGVGDLLISSPGEVRRVDGQFRLGVAYLVFGGRHLEDEEDGLFNLSQVGTLQLPGIVFISRFVQGTVDEAPLQYVGGLGSIDGDRFDDIAIGAPLADFINLASPDQRRPDAGEVYLIYGSDFDTNVVPDP